MKPNLLLAVDIGNTMASFGVMKGLKLQSAYSIEQALFQDQYKKKLSALLRKIHSRYPGLRKIVVCSVVPKKTELVKFLIKKEFKITPFVIGGNLHVPMKNNYRNPLQVGQDRLVGAYAALCLYGKPAVIVDFGTATTFDVVSKRGEYDGGVIVPGLRLSAEALFQRTALLPKIQHFKNPTMLIGKETKESMLSGIFFGYGVMARGLIDLIAKKIGGRPKVIVTGGYTHLMRKYISHQIGSVDRDLVFKGMVLLYPVLK